jgi:DNA-binding NarL/FixJ family response regulator
MENPMIKILIADDHPIVRRGLHQILAEQPDMAVLGEAQNAQELLELARRADWDVVVLDISMPDRGGLEALKELKALRPGAAVLVLSIHPEDQYAGRARKAGAAGYLTKDSAPEELVKAIRKVLAGGKYVSPSFAEMLALRLDAGLAKPLHEALSDREYQVLCLIASGKTVSQIAAELALSVKTVSTYRGRILEKMNMQSNAELTRYTIQNGLIA